MTGGQRWRGRWLRKMVLELSAVSLLTAGCGDDGLGPIPEAEVTVMTQNLYLGSALASSLVGSELEGLPDVVADLWATVEATDFPQRAEALADEIAEADPDLIGLQEATLYRRQSPGDVLSGNPVLAEEVVYDFLDIIQGELAARGRSYQVVVVQDYTDIELPMRVSGGLDDIRFTDRDAILVREGLAWSNARSGLYATNLSLEVTSGFTLNVLRGWTTVDVTVDGVTLHLWNTHLETQEEGPEIQVAQGQELLLRIQTDDQPLVAVGDFNSAADGTTTATYGNLLEGGLTDAWTDVGGSDTGYTCCHASDLMNATSLLNRRLDLIFYRSRGGALSASRLGADPADRTPDGLWPSDHAGVVATLRLRSPR